MLDDGAISRQLNITKYSKIMSHVHGFYGSLYLLYAWDYKISIGLNYGLLPIRYHH